MNDNYFKLELHFYVLHKTFRIYLETMVPQFEKINKTHFG